MLFQFLNGAIGVLGFKTQNILLVAFQFLNGAIGVSNFLRAIKPFLCFNS